MKSTGMVRIVDNLGRIVVPKELRKTLDINEADPMEIYINGEEIVLRKYKKGCHCCGEMKGLENILGLDICPKCRKELKDAVEIIDNARGVQK